MAIPENISWLLAATGALLILAGIVGGGFELKDVRMPKLSASTRVLAVVFGLSLIGLVVVGQIDPGSTDRNGPFDPVPSAPNVTRMPEAEGRALLEGGGFEVGEIRTLESWSPDGWILEQHLDEQRPLRIDLTVADSDIRFEARRTMVNADGDEIEAENTYELRLERISLEHPLVARFLLRSIRIRGSDDATGILQRLDGEPGHVPISQREDFDLETSWDAYSRLTKEIAHEMQSRTLQSETASDQLGATVMLMLAGLEIRFDLAAMLAMTSANEAQQSPRIVLQEGSELMSEIWLETPGVIADGGLSRAFRVFRRPPGSNEFDPIGIATYDADSGQMKRLEISYRVSDDDGLYRLQIDQGN